MIWITGPGRSGTTFVARLFWESGSEMGDTEGPSLIGIDKPSGGGMESPLVVTINDFLRDLSGKATSVTLIKKMVAHLDLPEVVKDPRFVLTHRLWEEIGIMPEYVVVCLRDSQAVTKSWAAADPKRDVGRQLIGTLNLLQWCEEKDIPHAIVSFPRIGLDKEYRDRKLFALIGEVDEFVESIWDKSMVHY